MIKASQTAISWPSVIIQPYDAYVYISNAQLSEYVFICWLWILLNWLEETAATLT
jgi:hypothetical protein